jgi:hypothetical protein
MKMEIKCWKSVLEDDSNLKSVLFEIAQIIKDSKKHDEKIGLLTGKFGLIVFLLYYDKYINQTISHKKVQDQLSEIFYEINKGGSTTTFCDGIAGISWGLSHLVKNEFINFDFEDFYSQISACLHQSMYYYVKEEGYFDFLHGAIGIGMLFTQVNTTQSLKYTQELICLLDDISIKEGNRIKWKSQVITAGSVYNFGLSHGIPSIIAFLANAYKNGIEKRISLELMNGAVNYLLSYESDKSDEISIFPSYVDFNGIPNVNSRLAWCYGDLGTSMSLWLAADATNNQDLKQKVINIFLNSSERTDLIKNGVKDAGICHGSAGIAHIFNRMYNYTGIEKFKSTSIYWFDQTLKLRQFEDGLAGFKAKHSDEAGGWTNQISILEGIAGIGLAMISAVSNIEPKWDECLLLS